MLRLLPLLLFMLRPDNAAAVDIRSVEVKVDRGIYHLRGVSVIEAPVEFVYEVLMDYDNFHRLASGLTETRCLEREAGRCSLAYTRADTCVLFFCRKLEKVETVETTGMGEVLTLADPARSDFEYNRSRWQLYGAEGRTRVTYIAEMDPRFWMPPLIGTWALRGKLEASAFEMGARIEYLHQTGTPLAELEIPED